jgi:predicted ester cyclase
MPPEAQEIRGAKPLKKFVREFVAAFPDWQDHIDLMFAADDKVAYITTSTATQTGQMGPFPPTGKRVKLVSIIIHRLENEKIAETWISWDNVSFMTQLGHFPTADARE